MVHLLKLFSAKLNKLVRSTHAKSTLHLSIFVGKQNKIKGSPLSWSVGHFHPSLTIVIKDGAYPSGKPCQATL
jgi:hypothetical protein